MKNLPDILKNGEFLKLWVNQVLLQVAFNMCNYTALLIFRIITILSAFLFGFLVVVISVQARTVLQLHTKIQMQGRVFSFLDVMIAISTPIPVLILGFFADRISILSTLIIMGAAVVVLTFAGNKIVAGKAKSQ